jgi:membrane protein
MLHIMQFQAIVHHRIGSQQGVPMIALPEKPIEKSKRFVTKEIWQVDTSSAPLHRRTGVHFLQVIIETIDGFKRHKGHLHASALTFWSVLSLVPLLAMAFGIAKGFHYEKVLENQLMAQFPGQEEVLLKVFTFSRALLENTRGGFIAGAGVLLLFWSVIKVFDNIEGSFNTIWQVKRSRTFIRKLVDYLALMILCPLFFILSSGLTVFITTQVTQITEHVALLGYFSALIFTALRFLPYGLIWVLFSMIYIIMPNTRVRLLPGISAGILAGTLYQLAQWFYIWSQIGVARYNAIYGSFAALPLFLIWMQISWIVVLFGTELSASIQNRGRLRVTGNGSSLNTASRRTLFLSILQWVCLRFSEGAVPPTAGKSQKNCKSVFP